MNIIYKIFGAYEWIDKDSKSKNIETLAAIKSLITQVESRVATNFKDEKIQIRYNRLRATAGSFLLDGIVYRIKSSDAVIFDISSFNPNVMFELGIAIEASRNLHSPKIFIICQGKSISDIKIPSDLLGYYISFYEIKKGKVVFHDNKSLARRLVSEIADKYNLAYQEYKIIDSNEE